MTKTRTKIFFLLLEIVRILFLYEETQENSISISNDKNNQLSQISIIKIILFSLFVVNYISV